MKAKINLKQKAEIIKIVKEFELELYKDSFFTKKIENQLKKLEIQVKRKIKKLDKENKDK